MVLKHPTKTGRAVVPRRSVVIIKPKVLLDVLDRTGLTLEELRELL